jgi:NADH dehydrogenase
MTTIRKATVFGGTGFIGRYVVRRLAALGARVVVVARRADLATYLQPMGDVGQIVLVPGSIIDPSLCGAALAGSDVAINLVGILKETRTQRFEDLQHQAAARLAQIASATGARRFIQISAIGADPDSPSAYGRSKAQGELAVLTAFKRATILRPSIVFGPEDDFFNRFAGLACGPASLIAPNTAILPLIGGGRTRFQPVYVEDVADAVIAAATSEEAEGKIFELGGPGVYSFRDLMALTASMIDRTPLLLPLPFAVAGLMARLTGWLPGAPLTLDQLRMLRRDNVVAEGSSGLAALGITPTGAEAILPSYLGRYRTGGWFTQRRWNH